MKAWSGLSTCQVWASSEESVKSYSRIFGTHNRGLTPNPGSASHKLIHRPTILHVDSGRASHLERVL